MPDYKFFEHLKISCSSDDTNGQAKYSNEFAKLIEIIASVICEDSDKSLSDKVQFYWVDLVGLMNNETITDSFPKIPVNQVDNAPIPSIYVGSQSIEDVLKSDVNINFKRLTQLDNNIWTYYINIQKKEDFEIKLKEILAEICFNYNNDLYNLQVSHEYLDYFTRLCRQNYLTGGHSSQVIPQLYTSKTQLKNDFDHDLERVIKYFEDGMIETLKIKVLLIDDYANVPLRKVTQQAKSPKGGDLNSIPHNVEFYENIFAPKSKLKEYSKASLLQKLWERLILPHPELKKLNEKNSKVSIELDILTGIDFEKIKDKYYDIILLDYNLNDPDSRKNGVYFLKATETVAKRLDGFSQNEKVMNLIKGLGVCNGSEKKDKEREIENQMFLHERRFIYRQLKQEDKEFKIKYPTLCEFERAFPTIDDFEKAFPVDKNQNQDTVFWYYKNTYCWVLDLLKKESGLNGPFGKLWVIPISSFSSAFMDEMRSKGVAFNNRYMKISRGADFVITSYLFFRNFIKMIRDILHYCNHAAKMKKNIERVKNEIARAKGWDEILDYQEEALYLFSKQIMHKADVDYVFKAEENHGILYCYKKRMATKKFKQEINFAEQLLYNLSYRNFEGNEDIVVYYDLLKKIEKL